LAVVIEETSADIISELFVMVENNGTDSLIQRFSLVHFYSAVKGDGIVFDV
jgi:hypothetical protein